MKTLLPIALLAANIACTPVQKSSPTPSSAIHAQESTVSHLDRPLLSLAGGHFLRIRENLAEIIDAKEQRIASNANLIRAPDENSSCPSRGFIRATRTPHGFSVLQLNCSGWHWIEEQIEFESSHSGNYSLRRVVLKYVDRREPEVGSVLKTFAAKDFGQIRFEDFQRDMPYRWKAE